MKLSSVERSRRRQQLLEARAVTRGLGGRTSTAATKVQDAWARGELTVDQLFEVLVELDHPLLYSTAAEGDDVTTAEGDDVTTAEVGLLLVR